MRFTKKIIKEVPLSNSTTFRRIENIGYNIEYYLIKRIKNFQGLLNASLLIHWHHLVFVLFAFMRYKLFYNNQVGDEFLMAKLLPTQTFILIGLYVTQNPVDGDRVLIFIFTYGVRCLFLKLLHLNS